MNKKMLIVLILILLPWTDAHSNSKTPFAFIENRNQWESVIKYKSYIPYGSLFLTNNGFTYVFYNKEDLDSANRELHHEHLKDSAKHLVIRQHAYRVNFVNANTENISYSTENKRPEYYNFFLGNDKSKWSGKVPAYTQVKQHNIYDGIDLALYSDETSLKYDFIVAVGADPAQITLNFEGVEPELMNNGKLKIKTSVNEVIEEGPVSYQWHSGKKIPVNSRYLQLKNGEIRFEFPDGYDQSLPLVIDPTLVFSTYNGSNGDALGFSACYDATGKLFTGSVLRSGLGGWPTTVGAFQTAVGGTFDCGINKFNTDGTQLLFSTYFGGSDFEKLTGMTTNSANELTILGVTGSSNLPVTPGSYQGNCQSNAMFGCIDFFVAHFSEDGTSLIGSTYVGGAGGSGTSGQEGNAATANGYSVNRSDIIYDNEGNILVAASSSSNNFPVTANAPQPVLGGNWAGSTGVINGNWHDGVVFKLNPTCSQLLFSTYLGGAQVDDCFSIVVNSEGNIVVCGGTKSSDFPTTPGALASTAPGNNVNGFVSVINPTTGALLSSTYLGTTGDDIAFHVQTDQADNVIILGHTRGNYPISAGLYNIPNGDLFLDKLAPDLSSSLQSTRLGNMQTTQDAFAPTAFSYNTCSNNTYISGYHATAQLPVTADAYQPNFLGSAFYICALNEGWTNLEYGTFLGTEAHVDGGTNRFDSKGTLYQAFCSGLGFITTPNVFAPTPIFGGGYEQGGFKFAFELPETHADISLKINSNDSGCVPHTIDLLNNSVGGSDYFWDFKDGSTSSQFEPTHTFIHPGSYNIMMVSRSEFCNTSDTAFLTITVFDTITPSITVNDTIICDSTRYVRLGASLNNWIPGVDVRYEWQPAGAILTGNTDSVITADISNTQVFIVTVTYDNSDGLCISQNSDSIRIVKSLHDPIHILNSDTTVCYGDSVTLKASGNDSYFYSWYPVKATTYGAANEISVSIFQSTVYQLRAADSLGCVSEDSVRINVVPCCEIGMPNAFSPNGDGINDDFTIATDGGIVFINFSIFNRFGEMVYNGGGSNYGWNGIYKNRPSDVGVYYYHILYSCPGSDELHEKRGDITLIR